MLHGYIADDPTTVNASSIALAGGYELGGRYRYKHSTYGEWIVRFGQFKDAIAYLAGHSVQFADLYANTFSNDRAGGSAVIWGAAGIVLKVMTQNYYGFVLDTGYYPTVLDNGDDDIAMADGIIISSTDGLCDSGTTAPLRLGVATTADIDAANTVAVFVNCGLPS